MMKTWTGNKWGLLGRYRRWLSNNGIPNETDIGWFTEEAFDDENIDKFCREFKAWLLRGGSKSDKKRGPGDY